MGRRRSRDPGRPRLLTPEVHEKLIDATRVGSPMSVAAAYVGISERAFQVWMKRGFEEDAHIADGGTPHESEAPFYELFKEVSEARSAAAVRASTLIQRASIGGVVTEETVKKYRDPETGAVVEETTVKRTPPDWRAAAWYLERQHPLHFGRQNQVQMELSGPGGGPVEVKVDAVSLAERVHAHMAELEAARVQASELAGMGDIVVIEAELDDTP